MCTIFVYGLDPISVTGAMLGEMFDSLCTQIAAIQALGLKAEDISVRFPAELHNLTDTNIRVFVEELLTNPACNLERLHDVAETIGAIISECLNEHCEPPPCEPEDKAPTIKVSFRPFLDPAKTVIYQTEKWYNQPS